MLLLKPAETEKKLSNLKIHYDCESDQSHENLELKLTGEIGRSVVSMEHRLT